LRLQMYSKELWKYGVLRMTDVPSVATNMFIFTRTAMAGWYSVFVMEWTIKENYAGSQQ